MLPAADADAAGGEIAQDHRHPDHPLHRVAVGLTLAFAPVADMGAIYVGVAIVTGAVFLGLR